MARLRRQGAPNLTLIADAAARSQEAPVGRERAPAARPAGHDVDWSVLMARAQDGDRGSYRRLLEEITPYLRSLAARRHREAGDVEDAVQDVLLTLHEIRHTYDPARPFGPWLVAIANRRIIDRLRRMGRTRSRETVLTAAHETFPAAPANLHDEDVDRHALRQAVEGLAPGQRAAIRLLKLEEKSLKEAAAESGMTVAALKVATHRALKSLRKMFSPRGNE
jgi:RNA polymerase sigma-70 factor (ECF subfamily)